MFIEPDTHQHDPTIPPSRIGLLLIARALASAYAGTGEEPVPECLKALLRELDHRDADRVPNRGT